MHNFEYLSVTERGVAIRWLSVEVGRYQEFCKAPETFHLDVKGCTLRILKAAEQVAVGLLPELVAVEVKVRV